MDDSGVCVGGTKSTPPNGGVLPCSWIVISLSRGIGGHFALSIDVSGDLAALCDCDLDRLITIDEFCLPLVCSGFELNLIRFDGLRGDDEAERDPDQVRVLEFGARAIVTVIDEDIEPLCLELVCEFVCFIHHAVLFGLDHDDLSVIRRDRERPDDSVVIVGGFDARGERPRDPDAVAPHDDILLLLVFVEDTETHSG